jgi:hypothetical protein
MNKYFFKIKVEENNTASMKAKLDIESILSKNGYSALYDKNSNSRILKFLAFIIKIMMKRKVVIICQYPFISKNEFRITYYLKKIKNIKLISIMHDLNSLRDLGESRKEISEEINYINKNDYIISHNESMTKWLVKNGVTSKIVNLEIFDYISKASLKKKTDSEFEKIYFAGNLDKAKSKFIYTKEMQKIRTKLILFGPSYSKESIENSNIIYRGSFPPDELANKFQRGFGLIWDGTSIHKCDGINGEYLRYNAPHKTSLYLSSGLPVIIWREAAMADFVERYKVGFTIDSLNEIDDILNSMTYNQYIEFEENAKKIGRKLLNGDFTFKAIHKVEKDFI